MIEIRYAFFGTGPLAESVLAALVRHGYIPTLLVTKPDAPQGRHMEIKPPHIKVWCDMKNIPVYQPDSLKELTQDSPLHSQPFDVFIVASYGKIIPDEILHLPKAGTLNVHPSLLPLYRGASPLESALLDGALETGVSIMKLDADMDHGPILVQNGFMIDPLATAGMLEVSAGQMGGELLTHVLHDYLAGILIPKEQDHSHATFCKKIDKALGEVRLSDSAESVRRKFRGLSPWPGIYFFITHKNNLIRIKINSIDLVSKLEERSLAPKIILSVTPEGRKEISWNDFEKGYLSGEEKLL